MELTSRIVELITTKVELIMPKVVPITPKVELIPKWNLLFVSSLGMLICVELIDSVLRNGLASLPTIHYVGCFT